MNFMDKFQEIGFKFSNQRHMDAVKTGVFASLPVTLAGSLFLIIRFLPVPGWSGVLETVLGPNYGTILSYPVAATFDMTGIIVLLSIAYNLAKSYKVDPFMGSIIALSGYFTLTPSFHMQKVAELDKMMQVSGSWALSYTGASSLFITIFTALVSVEIYRKVVQKGFVIKLPDMVPPNVSNNFMAIIPTFIVLVVMWFIRVIISLTPYDTIHNLVSVMIQTPLLKLGNTFLGYSVLIFLKDLFWTIGIHGPNMLSPILLPIEILFRDANRLAFETGEALPYIFATPYRSLFIQLGGSGNTFMFTLMCAFLGKSERVKSIGKLALGPAIFQINEPIIFGIPIVLNPIMMVPFLLSSFSGVAVGYLGMSLGLVGRLPGIDIPWTTPPIINAYMASNGDLTVVLAQIVTLMVTAVIYYPFFRIVDKQALAEERGETIVPSTENK